MASATMGLRRRVHQVGSSGGPGKRSRPDNNNSPSQGNLNSLAEPAPKKSRSATLRAKKELELAAKKGPPHWSDPRQYASIAGLSLEAQAALCSEGVQLPSPISYMSSTIATFVGSASLGKSPSVSYLDISNMTGRPGWTGPDALPGFPYPPPPPPPPQQPTQPPQQQPAPQQQQPPSPEQQQLQLPNNFPNDAMFGAYQPWVIKTYGDLAKTKTITIKKYARILRTLRGEEVNSAENSKFRFWVKSKGFHVGQPDGYEAKPADRIIGRHAVTNPGLDPPLYVPTQPPHNKALSGAEGSVSCGRVYKKVAIVENFFDIIHAVHVDLEGRPGKHAGQKRTYRTITETYAFLPREAVTRFLLGCTECQRRPRTPSPTSLATSTTPTPPEDKQQQQQQRPASRSDTPPSPKPATTLASSPGDAATPPPPCDRPREASHPPESIGPDGQQQQQQQRAGSETPPSVAEKPAVAEAERTEVSSPAASATTSATTCATTTTATGGEAANKPPSKMKDERYNPLSITNLLRKDPVPRRPTPVLALQPGSAAVAEPAVVPSSTPPLPPPPASSPPASAFRKVGALAADEERPGARGAWEQPETKCAPIDYSLGLAGCPILRQPGPRPPLLVTVEGSSEPDSEPEDEQKRGFSPAAGLIDTNLNLLATIQQLHCQVMLALTERLRPPSPQPTASPAAPAPAPDGGGAAGPAEHS